MSPLPIIDKYAARLLMLSFFLPAQLQVLVVIGAGAYFATRTFICRVPVAPGNYAWAVILGSTYLLYLLAFFLTPADHRSALYTTWEHRVSLMAMPLIFAIITPAFGSVIRKELIWFVYGCFLSCISGNLGAVYQYLYTPGQHILSHTYYRLNFETFSGIHPTYMGMYLSFSICILLFQEYTGRYGKVLKNVLLYLLIIFFLSLLAKSPLIAMVFIFIHYGYSNRQAVLKHKLLIGVMLLSVIAACFFIPFIGQRVQETLSYFGIGRPGTAADNSVYIRKLIWDIDTELLRPNWLTGVGPARVLDLLNIRYFFYSLGHEVYVGHYDPHNEYFYEWLCFGVVGILSLLGVLVLHFVKAIQSHAHLYIYLLLIVCITFTTETVLSRQMGVLFYAVFTSFFFFLGSDHKPDNGEQGK